jgi:hypothetical protein
MLVQVAGQLGGAGRLARALQADEDDDGRVAGQLEGSVAGREQRHQLFVDDLHDLLAGGQALEDLDAGRPLADARDEVLDDLEVDVRLEEGQPHFAHRGIDIVGADPAVARQGAECLAQPLAQSVEHGWFGLLIRPAAPKRGGVGPRILAAPKARGVYRINTARDSPAL